jgi:hypothetical protein
MLAAQETIGKISLLRDNVCSDIADNGPAPDKSIIQRRYHFDLPHNLLHKTGTFWNHVLEIIHRGSRRHSSQGQDGYQSGGEFG